jgi:hypothetical protein
MQWPRTPCSSPSHSSDLRMHQRNREAEMEMGSSIRAYRGQCTVTPWAQRTNTPQLFTSCFALSHMLQLLLHNSVSWTSCLERQQCLRQVTKNDPFLGGPPYRFNIPFPKCLGPQVFQICKFLRSWKVLHRFSHCNLNSEMLQNLKPSELCDAPDFRAFQISDFQVRDTPPG